MKITKRQLRTLIREALTPKMPKIKDPIKLAQYIFDNWTKLTGESVDSIWEDEDNFPLAVLDFVKKNGVPWDDFEAHWRYIVDINSDPNQSNPDIYECPECFKAIPKWADECPHCGWEVDEDRL